MLVRFIVGNFLSFNELTEFNMLPGTPKKHKHHIEECNKRVSVLKTAAIYGANGAGKSNLIEAVSLLQRIVQYGTFEFNNPIAFKKNPENQPSHLEIEFIHNNRVFLYGVELLYDSITEEWLYETTSGEDRIIFNKKLENGKVMISGLEGYAQDKYNEIRLNIYGGLANDTTTLLSIFNAEREKQVEEINLTYDFLSKYLSIILTHTVMPSNMVANAVENNLFFQFANRLIKEFDTGISRLDIETILVDQFYGINGQRNAEEIKRKLDKNNGSKDYSIDAYTLALKEKDQYIVKRLVTYHRLDDAEIKFNISGESEGTKRLLDYLSAFYDVLITKRTIIIDEIDRSIHPYLLKELLKSLLSAEHNFTGQLIFTTHESNLLDFDIFRQDEIWFAEKNKSGATELYPLSDYDVRSDLDWRKGYLNGRFGAIPFLGNLETLNWSEYEQVSK